ncbi:MAG: ABC transporter permease, partial [Bacteroidales bacterium]
MFLNYIKVALRNLLRSKVFSLINILGLAISMSICLLVIKMIFGMYSCDRFHVNKERIYRILTYEQQADRSGYELATTHEPLAGELEKLTDIERVVRIRKDFSGDVYYEGKVVPISGLMTDPVFFDVFSFELQRGDPLTALAEPYSIILTPEWASKLFGEKDPMGETISMKNLGDYKVTGITQSITKLKTNLKFECLASAATLPSLENKGIKSKAIGNWNNPYRTYTFIMIRKDTDIVSLEDKLQSIIETFVKEDDIFHEYRLQSLKKISPGKRLVNQMGEPTEPMMAYILILIAVILMLTASFTYTTLSVARAIDRAKEVGVRKVFGASRFHLFRQFIGEAVILSVISLNFAYVIFTFLEPGLYNLDYHIRNSFELAKTPFTIYLSFIVFTLILGCITGLAPALYLSKFKPVEVFKDLSKIRLFSRANLRKMLIVFQFSISLLMIFAIIISYKQVRFQQTVDYGYTMEDKIIIELQEMDFMVFKNDLIRIPAVEIVTASDYLPGTGVVHRNFVKSDNIPDSAVINHLAIDPDFVGALNMTIAAGNDFREYPNSNLDNYALINESAV